MSSPRTRSVLETIYQHLSRTYGPQHWWPANTPFEMMVGALLTQATQWRNVEQAITRLRSVGALSPQRMARLATPQLQRLIRPAGYFRQKTQRLQRLTRWYLSCYQGQARRMFRTPWRTLRQELLRISGIGPETADSILLYAGAQPVAVVDTYTTRIFRRHRLIRPGAAYEDVQRVMMQTWPRQAARYNEFHALLVEVGKRSCHRHHPACDTCPLGALPRTLEVINDGNR